MKAQVRVNNVFFEVDESTEVDTFKGIARIHEIFSIDTCGVCGSKNIKFVCRKDKDENDWTELVCQEMLEASSGKKFRCNAKLPYGNTKKGGDVYPKLRLSQLSEAQAAERQDDVAYAEKNNGFLPNNGWFRYKKKD